MKEKNIPVLSCAVVRDLLPLYIDGKVTALTGEAISRHIDRCPGCAIEMKNMQQELPPVSALPDSRGGFDKMMKKNKRKNKIKAVCFFIAGAAMLLVLYYLLMQGDPWL